MPGPIFGDDADLTLRQGVGVVGVVLEWDQPVAVVALEEAFAGEPEETSTVLMDGPNRRVGKPIIGRHSFQVGRRKARYPLGVDSQSARYQDDQNQTEVSATKPPWQGDRRSPNL